MSKWWVLVWVLVLAGCSEPEALSSTGKIAQTYLEHEGYGIVSFEGELETVYSESSIKELPDMMIWDVQGKDPTPYMGLPIQLVTFVVKGHPLDDTFGEGNTSVTVMMMDERVIGGWSLPRSKDPLVGGVYSLDGLTENEVNVE